MLETLSKNVERNGFGNVRLRALAASDVCTERRFDKVGGRPNMYSLEGSDEYGHFSVLSVTIDWLIEAERIDRVDLIKIDAEGPRTR